jgi:carbonic anhydrase
MPELSPVKSKEDIPSHYQDTPIGRLLEYHNLGHENDTYENAELLVGMCMDHRKRLRVPENFAFIIRAGGANLRNNEFKVSYSIGIGGIQHIALIGHTNCGMVNLAARKNQLVSGLVKNAGWSPETAEEHFHHFAPMFEIGNEIDFTLSEAKRLRHRYPKLTVVPLLYQLEDNQLYLIEE